MSDKTLTKKSSQARWYRGDFHAHTTASWDGHLSLSELAEVAKAERLDFFAVTDHNSIGTFSDIQNISDMLILPGIEVTTKRGHANIFGMTEHQSWMDSILGDEEWDDLRRKFSTANALTAQTAELGLLNSINHPLMTPWAWQFFDTEFENIHALEIWNDPSYPTNVDFNPQTLTLWTKILNAGLRLTGIGGSDYHRPKPASGETKPPERLGTPTTYVCASELSVEGILSAVKQHRAYVSMGAEVDLRAHCGEESFGIGETIDADSGSVTFLASVLSSPRPAHFSIVKNGEILVEMEASKFPATLNFKTSLSKHSADWYRLDVFDDGGEMLAITNPIFTGKAAKPKGLSFSDFI